MKKTLFAVMAICTALIMTSCNGNDSIEVTNGVSETLAAWRKANVDDVCYQLHFNIPERRDEKVTQLDEVFNQVALSLKWLEDYTDMPQPFSKYGFVILPGYQFGGMEHPGCIQFRDRTIFLEKNPTPDEELDRLQLIAHETAHLWFGDCVTMRWFNDVWTKEVFANFMADKIAREQFPNINHDLNFLKTHYVASFATDRTDGTHPIQQSLDNLNNAGLLYGNIIYHKAPIMMRKLEETMGEEPFRKGLRKYLKQFSYNNATWDDLIAILDAEAPQAGIKEFDRQWVKAKGMETVNMQINNGDFDPMTYGNVVLSKGDAQWLLDNWCQLPETKRFAAMMYLYENYLHHRISNEEIYKALSKGIDGQDNSLVASTCNSYLMRIISDAPQTERMNYEKELFEMGTTCKSNTLSRQIIQGLSRMAASPEVNDAVYQIWESASNSLFNERDYINMSYHLAIMRPNQWKTILAKQRARLKNDDVIREFDFVSRACNPDTTAQKELFASLLKKENRTIEPYAANLLSLLNSEWREPFNNQFITPGLDVLEEVQQTGDIFFPLDWCHALLGGHRSDEAKQQVQRFLDTHPNYPLPLKNKLLQAAFMLLHQP